MIGLVNSGQNPCPLFTEFCSFPSVEAVKTGTGARRQAVFSAGVVSYVEHGIREANAADVPVLTAD